MSYVVVDLGGTKTRIALFPSLADTAFTELERFETRQVFDEQIKSLSSVIRDIGDLQGVAVAYGGQLTRDGSTIDMVYTMPDYVGKPLISVLANTFGCPVVAANDNVCAVLAETCYGNLSRFDRAAYLTVSTGTGAGIRLGGDGVAVAFLSQVGHHIIDPHGERCRCGQVGCVQTITGGRQIEARYGKKPSELDDPQAWQTITGTLAIAVVNLVRMLRLDAICLGGGIGLNSAYLREHLPTAVKVQGPEVNVEILYPRLGENAPLVGASLLLRDDLSVTILH